MTKKTLILIGLLILFGCLSFAQTKEAEKSQETESTVPELVAFHDVIYPIWHTAYPEKDYDALRGFVKQINDLAEKVYGAELPGILRDKADKWKEGLAQLKLAVEKYNAAASGTDNQALLDAAEELHSRYEMMVRLIWPVLKEVDEFHKVLYVIYHKYLPNKEFDKIKAVSEDLQQKAEAVTTATLPKRLESKTEDFQAASGELNHAVKELLQACQSGDASAIVDLVEKVHTKYQNLEKIFD